MTHQLWHFSFDELRETELTPTYRNINEYSFDMLCLEKTKVRFFTDTSLNDTPSGNWMWFFHHLPDILYPLSKEAFELIETPKKQINLQQKLEEWYNNNCIDTEEEARMYYYGGSLADENNRNIYSPIQQVLYKRKIHISTKTHVWHYNFFVYEDQVYIRLFHTSKESCKTDCLEEYCVDLELFKQQTYLFCIHWVEALEKRLETVKIFDWACHQKAYEITIIPPDKKFLDRVIEEKKQQYTFRTLFTPKEFNWNSWVAMVKMYILQEDA